MARENTLSCTQKCTCVLLATCQMQYCKILTLNLRTLKRIPSLTKGRARESNLNSFTPHMNSLWNRFKSKLFFVSYPKSKLFSHTTSHS